MRCIRYIGAFREAINAPRFRIFSLRLLFNENAGVFITYRSKVTSGNVGLHILDFYIKKMNGRVLNIENLNLIECLVRIENFKRNFNF